VSVIFPVDVITSPDQDIMFLPPLMLFSKLAQGLADEATVPLVIARYCTIPEIPPEEEQGSPPKGRYAVQRGPPNLPRGLQNGEEQVLTVRLLVRQLSRLRP
jgi:hypothetical protein